MEKVASRSGDVIGETLRALLADPMPLVTMSAAAQQIVPGGGTAKVVNELRHLWRSKLAGAGQVVKRGTALTWALPG